MKFPSYWSRGVTVSTLDSESEDCGFDPRRGHFEILGFSQQTNLKTISSRNLPYPRAICLFHVHVCVHVCVHVHVRVRVCACARARVCVCMRARVRVHVCVCVHVHV